MIIFGFSVYYFLGLIGTGEFQCPHCRGDRTYEHRTARRFFTLFFVPLIPLDKVGEVVQCQTCRLRFDPVVLRRPTSAQLANTLVAGMRAAVTAILHAGGSSDVATRTAIGAVRVAGAAQYDVSQLRDDLNQPPDATVGPLRTMAAQLAPDVCERWLATAVKVGLADGPLSPAERDSLRWIATNLGLTPAHAEGVIATTERAAAHHTP